MVLRGPLSVVVNDGSGERNVTQYASGLRMRKSAPGGDTSAEVSLAVGRDFLGQLSGGSQVRIDGPAGRTIWQGFADYPGRVDGAGGQGVDLTALGCSVLAQDRRQALIYRDAELTAWEQVRAGTAANAATAQAGDDPSDTESDDPLDGLLCQFPQGQVIGNGSVARLAYLRLLDADMDLGAFKARVKSGKTDASGDYTTALVVATAAGSLSGMIVGTGISTTAGGATRTIGDHYAADMQRAFVQLRRAAGGATTVGDDNTWSFFDNVAVLGRRYLSTGVLAADGTEMVTADYVRADWVVWDLITRLLPQVDRAGAVVEVPGSPVQIDQLAFPDGATAGEVLDHLLEHEPTFLWEIGAARNSLGLRFAWREWPTTARYEISTADGFDQPGGDFELCNRVTVVWTDARGRDRTTVVTADSSTYPALKRLEDAGRVRDAETVELPEGRGSAANALRIGEAVLAASASPPASATATLRRPIANLQYGRLDMPYEVEPGCLVRVRETGDVIRLTETEYDDDAGSVQLTLGNPQPSTDELVARLPQIGRRVA